VISCPIFGHLSLLEPQEEMNNIALRKTITLNTFFVMILILKKTDCKLNANFNEI
jgi:hypothetical protein